MPAMIRTTVAAMVALATSASSFNLIPNPSGVIRASMPPRRSLSRSQVQSFTSPAAAALSAKFDRGRGKYEEDEKAVVDRALRFFQHDSDDNAKLKRGIFPAFERHRAAAEAEKGESALAKLKESFDRIRAAASSDTAATRDDTGRAAGAADGVDVKLLNRLLVHAEKILSADDGTIDLIGAPVEVGRLLSQNTCDVVVEGDSYNTKGIRAFFEVSGPKRNGMALLVGNRRGVLLLKLTVGGRTLDVRVEEGLDIDVAHGVKKLRP